MNYEIKKDRLGGEATAIFNILCLRYLWKITVIITNWLLGTYWEPGPVLCVSCAFFFLI